MWRTVRRERKWHCFDQFGWLWSQSGCTCQMNYNWPHSCCFSSSKERIMVDIEYNEKQLQQIYDTFGSKAVQDIFDRSIKKSVLLLERYAIEETPVDQNRLRSSFQTQFAKSFGRLFNPTNYAIYVHEWTRPHYAPIDKLKWRADRHWIPVGALRLSIARKWTKANPFMDRAVDRWEKQVDEIFSKEIDNFFNEIFK